MSMQMDNIENRRRHARAPLVVAVGIDSENNFYAGITGDVSEGGVFLATDGVLTLGSSIEMTLTLPGFGRSHLCRAQVRWIQESRGAVTGYGLEWVYLPGEALTDIHAFVNERDTLLFDAA
jgi:Tfp pilus assembly protein PilZ